MRSLLPLMMLLAACATSRPPTACVPPGRWADPATLRLLPDPTAQATTPRVVLLGEVHDSAADHAWQLAGIERLHATNPMLQLGFEMFPRRDQAVLESWTRGELGEAEFLRRSDWRHVWGFDPALYLPIFRFARDHRLPMLALNVSPRVVRLAAQHGWTAVAPADREGLGDPAPPSAAYRAALADAMSGHGGPPMTPERLGRFVDAQQVWDRAMAEAIAAGRAAQPRRTVVAIMGAGHLENRDGVPHQLDALGLPGALVLIPVGEACTPPGPGYADAIYVTGPDATPPPSGAPRS